MAPLLIGVLITSLDEHLTNPRRDDPEAPIVPQNNQVQLLATIGEAVRKAKRPKLESIKPHKHLSLNDGRYNYINLETVPR